MPAVPTHLSTIPEFMRVHYQVARGLPVCGAYNAVRDKVKSGVIADEFAAIKIPSTTDIERVTCAACQRYILTVANAYEL